MKKIALKIIHDVLFRLLHLITSSAVPVCTAAMPAATITGPAQWRTGKGAGMALGTTLGTTNTEYNKIPAIAGDSHIIVIVHWPVLLYNCRLIKIHIFCRKSVDE
jgi:hypothetical protein